MALFSRIYDIRRKRVLYLLSFLLLLLLFRDLCHFVKKKKLFENQKQGFLSLAIKYLWTYFIKTWKIIGSWRQAFTVALKW